MEKMCLYHGSPKGIKGNIAPISEEICDFGRGFYTATDIDCSLSNIIVNEKGGEGYLYTLEAELFIDNLKIYKFDDMRLWMLYTAYNRGALPENVDYKKLQEQVEGINDCDVIIGLVADDRSAYAFQRFLANAMTDECLIRCISHFNLGYQYVFKTERACKQIKIIEEKLIAGRDYDDASHNKRVRIGTSQEIVKKYETEYRRIGLLMEELLEEYR